ncbi:unnamed protein product [Trichogramma brassicae]|uniref:RNA-directed DNA polymerase n=1 Tax=Trichogramma brassicae TaxID=86971 RepID=A0A6H5IZ33_9HYME|nr:unnamed protein product [Trichogramma brassicae]
MFQDYEERRLPVRQNQNENPANPNPPREDPPAAETVRVVAEATASIYSTSRRSRATSRHPLEQLIGNPLFQAMARAPAVNAVGNCRLPAFWRSDPDLWFLQVEAQFNIHQVTSDSTRFNMILTVLDPETISEVSDIIRAPPAQDKYTTLKDAIVARLTDSPDTQLHKLLGTIELGDKKPSQLLLLQMRTLAGARASNDILRVRVRWLDLLPDSTRRLLTIIKNQTIDELAAVADELHAVGPSVMATEVGRPRSRPASPGGAASSNSNSVGAQEIAELRAAIVQLTEITRAKLSNVEISLEVALARELNHARSHDLAHQHRIEARPRGTAGTTRDTATWQSSAEARARDGHDRRLPGATSNRHVRTARLCPPSGASPAIDSQPRRPNSRSCSIGASSGLHRASGPVHCTLVPKPGNTWRITGDYRLLNARTQPDRHPLPIIEDLLQESVGKVFSVVDLYKAFYQIPVAEEDISKTAVTTPFGLFEFVGMPLGLRNSAQTFQRTMNYLLRDLDFVRCYQDDILVLSAAHEQHLQHLRELLTILKRARLFVNWEKCQIGRSEVVFAGYLISERGFEPPAAKVEAIARFPKPSDSTQLRRFIGMLNFYRRCLPRAAELMSPLTDLLRGLQKKKGEACMERSSRRGIRAHQAGYGFSGQPLALHTDASNTAIGAALSQRHADDDWTPLGFFSQKLSPTQQRYSTYDRELLAIFEAIKYFQRILEGRSFTIMTDHRPLSFALEQKSDKFSPRQSRQLDFISRFDAKIVYTPGDENPVADALSRIDAITMPTTLNSAQISAEQQKDEQLTHLRGKAKLKLHDVVIDGLSLVCVEQRDGLKPYLPESLRRQAFDTAHTLSHPSGRATVKRVALLYFWPSMSKDIVRWAKQCVPCQQSKVHRHNRAELGNFVTPDGRFDHVHIDIVKMPLHQGFQNCLTMIDRYTRWPQAIPIGDMSAQTVAKAFFHGWISFFGTPLTITTDQGAQFEGKLLAQLCKLVGAKHVHTSPYHPQANSMVERMHRTLKAALKCSPETPWTLALPGVLLGLRTTFKEDLQASPAEMVFGTSLRIPGEFVARQEPDNKTSPSEFVSALRRLFQAIRPVPASRHVQHRPFVFKDLATSDYVFRRRRRHHSQAARAAVYRTTQSHPPHQRAKLCRRRRKWRRQDALYRSAQASLPGCRRQRSITGNTGAANYHAAFINTESHLFTPCANCPVPI